MAREKVLVIADVPSPHQNLFFDAVARRDDVDLLVYFCRKTMPGRAWSGEGPRLARHKLLAPWAMGNLPTNPSMLARVLLEKDRVPVVIGYYLPGMLLSGFTLGTLGRPWVFWTDTLPPPKPVTTLSARARNGIRRWFLSHATLCASTGAAGREALLQQNVPADRARVLPFVTDRERIAREVDALLPKRDELRRELGLELSRRTLLFVGQMIKRKGVDVLLEAFASSSQRDRLQLLLVGEGVDRESFRAGAARLGISERVVFHDYVDNAQLPRFWAAADGFVLPSRFDPWPVVVIEALAAGLPVLGTRACGSVRDGVTPKENGWMVEPDDPVSLARALEEFSQLSESALAAMRSPARAAVERWSPEKVAADFVALVAEARRRAGR